MWRALPGHGGALAPAGLYGRVPLNKVAGRGPSPPKRVSPQTESYRARLEHALAWPDPKWGGFRHGSHIRTERDPGR